MCAYLDGLERAAMLIVKVVLAACYIALNGRIFHGNIPLLQYIFSRDFYKRPFERAFIKTGYDNIIDRRKCRIHGNFLKFSQRIAEPSR